MAGKENNFVLGTRGINLVDEPLALEDGDLQNAQNAEFRRTAGKMAIGIRGGLARLNASDLGGSILGGANIPLPSPLSASLTRAFLVARNTLTANTWQRSTNGTTWATAATPSQAQTYAQAVDANFGYFNQRCVSYQGKLIYPGSDYVQYPTASDTAPPIRVWDGTNDFEIGRVPKNPESGAANTILINDFVVHSNRVYYCTYDPGGAAPNHFGRVIELDLGTGQMTQIGDRFDAGSGGMPYCLCSHNGLLWVGTYGIGGSAVGNIYSINVDTEDTWTLRHTTGIGAGYILSMASYRGILYFGCQGDAGSAALVRTLANDYTTAATSDTGSDTTAFNYYAALTVYNDELYAVYVSNSGAPTICHVRKFDGSSWTTDLDVDAAQSDRHVGQAFVNPYDDSLLIAFLSTDASAIDGFIYRKASGAWTAVETGLNCRGFLGRVDTA